MAPAPPAQPHTCLESRDWSGPLLVLLLYAWNTTLVVVLLSSVLRMIFG